MKTILAVIVLVAGLKVANAPAGPVPAEVVKVLAASYSYGSEFADVTELVRRQVAAGEVFQANPGCLHADPHPGMNKALVVFCEVMGKPAIFSVGEGEDVSGERMLEKARPVVNETSAGFSSQTPRDQPRYVAVRGPGWDGAR